MMSLQISLVWVQLNHSKPPKMAAAPLFQPVGFFHEGDRITIVWRHLPESLRKPIYPWPNAGSDKTFALEIPFRAGKRADYQFNARGVA